MLLLTLYLKSLRYKVKQLIVFLYSYRFTQIAVDPQVKTPGGKAYDVLFIGTGNFLPYFQTFILTLSLSKLILNLLH